MDDSDNDDTQSPDTPTFDELVRFLLDQPPPAQTIPQLIDLASVGLALDAWRNSPLEDAHSSPDSPLTDGEMMRTNAATTRLVREFLTTFLAYIDDDTSSANPPPTINAEILTEFDDIDLMVEELLTPLHTALTRRVLPCGYTVAEATGDLYHDLTHHVANRLDMVAHITENHGLRAALYLHAHTGAHEQWWLTPTWPDTIHALHTVLAEPAHHHWNVGGYPDPAHRPDRAADIDQLAAVLTAGPDRLTAAEAQWCVNTVGIGYLPHPAR